MSTRILSITLLLLACLCFQSSAGNLRLPSRRFPPCCVKLTTTDISRFVTGPGYREQSAKAPCVEAIIFDTQQGPVCANPRSEWVQRIIGNMRKL